MGRGGGVECDGGGGGAKLERAAVASFVTTTLAPVPLSHRRPARPSRRAAGTSRAAPGVGVQSQTPPLPPPPPLLHPLSRAIVTAEKALLFEPNSATTRKFLEVVLPRLQTHGMARQQALMRGDPSAYVNVSHADYMARFYYQVLTAPG